ncbi:MAG TPA: Holliday junction branch migration DNA helicase RuvB [Candidatus Paceibacterota bacterium]
MSTEAKLETFLDAELRPREWDDYVGQKLIKKNLRVLIRAAKERNEPIEHLLFYGPPGLGKTTLAHLIAKELSAQIKVASGPAIEKVGDLASILTNLTPGDILFIDEAHRLNKVVGEILYPAMESGNLNIIIGKGPSARSIQLELPRFTLIAATTRVALLSQPLRSRFSGGTFRMEFYTNEETKEIVTRSAKVLGVPINEDASYEIAKRSRFTPRIANHFLKRARDYAQINNKPSIDIGSVRAILEMMGIDEAGLTSHDRQILTVLIDKFGGGPVGLQTLSAATSEEEATIEEVCEPYLLQLGFIDRTSRGRVATPHAYTHLGKKSPQGKLM